MRDRIWNNLYNTKFQSLYSCECSRHADQYGRYSSLFIVIASASSTAAWAFWKDAPFLWASIIAVAQILHLAKPYFPFIKNDKVFLELSYELESLYIEYEKLWYSFENNKITPEKAEQKFYELRDKELKIGKTHKGIHCPTCKRWMNKISKATDDAININVSKGE